MELDLFCDNMFTCNSTSHCLVFTWGPLKVKLLKLLPDDGAKLLVHLPVLPEAELTAEVSCVASAAHLALWGKADLEVLNINQESCYMVFATLQTVSQP